ncbi:hypothetical protein ACIPSJ_25345 [Streptomyces sp. NPDC090088]|uniref:hypothetical protein n=1 Tax=Streptomyces sp. NPDC090088 TaxID=3365944 RepID=UPI0038099AF4
MGAGIHTDASGYTLCFGSARDYDGSSSSHTLAVSQFGDKEEHSVTPPPGLTRDQLKARLHDHMPNHYTQLHGTLVSIALGAAGFAAAGLAIHKKDEVETTPLMWLMWVGGLLAIAAVYSGTVTGVFALPAGIPSLWDLLIPLAIGLAQFMVFGVLTRSVVDFSNSGPLVVGWFAAMTGVGAFAVAGILRARRLLKLSSYETSVRGDVSKYRERLTGDAVGAGILAVVSATGASLRAAGVHVPQLWMYVHVCVILGVLLFGLFSHHKTKKKLETLFGVG